MWVFLRCFRSLGGKWGSIFVCYSPVATDFARATHLAVSWEDAEADWGRSVTAILVVLCGISRNNINSQNLSEESETYFELAANEFGGLWCADFDSVDSRWYFDWVGRVACRAAAWGFYGAGFVSSPGAILVGSRLLLRVGGGEQ